MKKFKFINITQYNKFVINLSANDYYKLKDSIKKMQDKYSQKIINLYQMEKDNADKFSLSRQKKFILCHKKILINLINDVIKLYEDEFYNLEVLFLSGSFARCTNKMSSDIDLHFFYTTNEYNYVYEEIVCYIISRVLGKSRDCIDPTFILNLNQENKNNITKKMSFDKLKISLKFRKKMINYSYNEGKKRRFYIQYSNSRNINDLFQYLKVKVMQDNYEWCHCFEIIKGNNKFNTLYNKLCMVEKSIINRSYILNRIILLIKKLQCLKLEVTDKSISQYKKNYQSKVFECIYEYISIIRFILIYKGDSCEYINLLNIYSNIKRKYFFNELIFKDIYEYMWHLEKFTLYCYERNINYGLHNFNIVNYNFDDINKSFKKIKINIIFDLERMKNLI